MLVIRLQRTGKNKEATYRIAVAQKSDPVKKKSIEIVGHFLPTRDPVVLEFKKERIEHWMKQGAKPSDTLARLLKKEGVDGMDAFIEKYTKQKKKKEQKEEAPEATEASADKEETPKEEAKDEPPEEPAEEEKKEENTDSADEKSAESV